MKKNFIISLVLLIICFGLTITAIVFNIKEDTVFSTYFGMGATGVAFLSCLFGLNSWKEK